MIINTIKALRDNFGKQKRNYSVTEVEEELTKCVRE